MFKRGEAVKIAIHRSGGVTEWRQAAGLAACYGREFSSHPFPEVSAHLLAATKTQPWLEYVDRGVPIADGMRRDTAAATHFRLD
jgi:mandelate racemase